MNNIINIIIADDNAEFASLLGEQIDRELDIKVMGIAHDGLEAVDLIEKVKPDLVILDLIMPNLDGIGVLERIKESKIDKKPIFIILSAMCQDSFVKHALSLGAQYYVVKPFNILVLISRIRQICSETEDEKIGIDNSRKAIYENNNRNIEAKVTELIHNSGIQTHLAGFRFLRDAVIFAVNDERLLRSITRDLYAMVAKKNGSEPQKIERSIRSAIVKSYNGEDFKDKRKTTNAKLIIDLVSKMKNI